MPKSLLRSIALLAAGAAIPTVLIPTVQTARAAESDKASDTYRELDQFMNVFQKVRADYVDKIDDKALIKGAIDGMLASLDPHSSYLDSHDFQQMKLDHRRQLWRPRPHRAGAGRRGEGGGADAGHAGLPRRHQVGRLYHPYRRQADLRRRRSTMRSTRCAARRAPRSSSPSSAPAATSRSTSR